MNTLLYTASAGPYSPGLSATWPRAHLDFHLLPVVYDVSPRCCINAEQHVGHAGSWVIFANGCEKVSS